MVHLVLIDKRSCLFTGFVFCAVLFFSGRREATRISLENCLYKVSR